MAAFKASYADVKMIKTRQCVQIVFEIPVQDFDAAYEVLGGLPNPAAERWFGIAAIKDPAIVAKPEPVDQPRPARAKRDWRDIPPAQQAGIRRSDPIFAAFLKEQRASDWREASDAVECVRLICGVQSCKELGSDHRARVIWHQLDEQFQAWAALEHAS
jgi:hypothetical protein